MYVISTFMSVFKWLLSAFAYEKEDEQVLIATLVPSVSLSHICLLLLFHFICVVFSLTHLLRCPNLLCMLPYLFPHHISLWMTSPGLD